MKERRKFSRMHLIHYLTIFDRETGRLIGNLVDVSPEGILIIVEKPLETGILKHLRMNFPEEVLDRQLMEFDAQVIWCQVDINPDLFAVGLRILEILPEDREVINELIEIYRD
jgi:hypothetical protein